MLPGFLVPETVINGNGNSAECELGESQGKVLSLTLGILRAIEQESLDISIWGSADKTEWGAKPLLTFPQKFYCGTYNMTLDLSAHPELQYLRVQWKSARWGRGDASPLFGIYVFAETRKSQVAVG